MTSDSEQSEFSLQDWEDEVNKPLFDNYWSEPEFNCKNVPTDIHAIPLTNITIRVNEDSLEWDCHYEAFLPNTQANIMAETP